MNATLRLLHASLSAAALFSLSGCSGPPEVKGRVIPGAIGMALAAEPSDPRLTEDGIANIRVELLNLNQRGVNNKIGDAVTAADGSFSIKIPESSMLRRATIVRARGQGWLPASETLPVIDPSRPLLVLMKKDEQAPQPAGATPDAKPPVGQPR